MEYVYHYSDTVRFPWIMDSGELRPTDSPYNGYPNPDFLWATTNDKGCPSATLINRKELYKAGIMHVVRFTLSAEDFQGWPQLAIDHPDWTALHISILNKTGVDLGDDPRTWRCRIGTLRGDRWVAVHARSYRDNRWVELPRDLPIDKQGDVREINIPQFGRFVSRKFKQPDGKTAYQVRR
jgi:hypothetical protein